MFIIVGAAGVLLAVVWWIVHRDPPEVDLTSAEVHYLTEGDENASSRPPSFAEWRKLFAHRTTWGMIAGFFGTIYALWLYTSGLPYYLEHERHMSVARVGVVAAIPYFFGCVGAVFGGWLCDFLTRRGWTPMRGRKLLISCALLGISLCTVGTVLAQSNTIALTLISVSLFLIYISSSAYPPFLEAEKTVVDMSGTRAKTRSYPGARGNPRMPLAQGQDFTWPIAPGVNGTPVDLRAAPANATWMGHTTTLMEPSRPLAYVTVLNTARHYLLGYVFRREEYPWVQN